MTHRKLGILPLLLIPAFAFFSAPVFAAEDGEVCSSNADCNVGGTCEKSVSSSDCELGPDGDSSHCDNTVQVSETGYCHTPPPQCTSDSDCDEYLSCVKSNLGTCSSTPGGEAICEDASSESYCAADPIICESDSECPREFECTETESTCLLIACPIDDPDCGVCESDGHKECRPKAIDCQSDDQCPSEWSCLGTTNYECSGEGGTVDAPAGAPADAATGSGESGSSVGGASGEEISSPAKPSDPVPVDPDFDRAIAPNADPDEGGPDDTVVTCVEVPAVGSCYPDTWGGGGRYAIAESGLAAPSSSNEATSDDGSDSSKSVSPATPPLDTDADLDAQPGLSEAESGVADEEGGGCSLAPAQKKSSGWLFSLLLLVPVMRRRFGLSR